jgi:Icc-related predicted phosphoesterase
VDLGIFPIGDLHIESKQQSKIFAEYLNLRDRHPVVLLGDTIHFVNSFWNRSCKSMSTAELMDGLDKDVSIWEDFVKRLKIPTLCYLGSHEQFALRAMRKLLPSRKLSITNRYFSIPRNLQIVRLGSQKDPLFLTGLHIPDNIHPAGSQRFLQRREKIEEWIEKQMKTHTIPQPHKTVLCTHDPTDFFYSNMGYRALTQVLQREPFKVHYHAHIHSNIRQTVIGKTPSVNRSFIALSKLDPQALEPNTEKIRSLFERDI